MNRQLDKANVEIELLRESNTLFDVVKLTGKTASTSTVTAPTASSVNKQGKQPTTQPRAVSVGAKNATTVTSSTPQRRNVYNIGEILSDPIKTRLYIDKLNMAIRERVSQQLDT